ncbi:MAG: hypothetical protein EAX89_13735 [Candidatus Lokiarchaeota archaeon]|nr:hypothetical protein [Candidatus Lokiarchaeota archaeon]
MPNNTKKPIEVYFIDKIPLNVQNYLINNLSHLENVKLNFIDKVQEEYILENISEAHIIIGWRPTLKMLEKADNLKLVINPGAGIRHLLDTFREINKKRKINLVNGHGNSYFVAQHAVALLLSLMNKIIPHHEWMKEGKWRTGDKEGASIPLRFRKVGLFGYGAINQKVHQMLAGFEVEFSILRKHWDKQTQELITPAKKYQFWQFHDFLKEIDILIIAVPATTITEGIIQQKELELLGPNALIVNVARGEIINEANLYNSLKENVIAGAAIDVWYNYDPQNNENGKKYPYSFPFHKLDNIILSPHRGYSPFSDLLRWNEVIENISRMSQGRNDFVNLVSLEDEY